MKLPVTLQENENVVKLLRRHPVRVISVLLGAAIFTLLLLLLLNWMRSLVPAISTVWYVLMALVAFVGIIFMLLEFYRYRNDLWVVTNQRLIDSIKRNPFNHEVSSTDLINVQDISTSKSGILQTIFDYGDVHCQTASSSQAFTILGVPHPSQVLELIDSLRDKARQSGQVSSV